jgi:hypothetical protein
MDRRRRCFQWTALAVFACLALGWPSVGGAEETSCGVKYVSAEHVYLDTGTVGGLVTGLQARVVRGSQTVARLEVVFTARYSASCVVISSTAEVLPGDTVVCDAVRTDAPADAPALVPSPRRTRTVADRSGTVVQRPGPRWSGSVALRWDHADETDDRALSHNLVSVPFRLRATRLPGDAEFRARGSVRRIARSGYSSATPGSQWRNRVRQAALVRDGRRQDFHFAVGRIATRFTASAGSFDGFALDRRVRGETRTGVFAGFTPSWDTSAFSTDNRLAGVTVHYVRRSPRDRVLDVTVAGVGRYNRDGISREYVTMTSHWRQGARISLMQAAELDVNRKWRKTAGTGTVEMTSLALTGRYRLIRAVTVNAGYDDRSPIRTWESRSLPDSLFDNAGRTGWRAGAVWTGSQGKRASLRGSLRDRAKDADRTASWNGRVFLPTLTPAAVDLNLAVRGFDGPYLSGWSPTLGVGRALPRGARIGLESGYSVYSDNGTLADRDRTWLEISGSAEVGDRWSIFAEYRRDWGDDIAGNRLFLEMRRKL